MTCTPAIAVVITFVASLGAQAPSSPQDAQAPVAADAAWSPGEGQGSSYRSALARAISSAVVAARGAGAAEDASVRARLRIVAEYDAGLQVFDASGERERAWVLGQLVGIVDDYVVASRVQGEGAAWVVRVRARVASVNGPAFVVELEDGGIGSWELERFEEGGLGQAFDRRRGRFEGPPIASYLRRSGLVKLASGQTDGAERAQSRSVPSHRVVVTWKPLAVRSTLEKPNPARPTKGPRPEQLSGGVAEVTLRVEDLTQGVTLLNEELSIPSNASGAWPSSRLDAYVNELVDQAKAQVAQRIYFALSPPVVLRKWVAQGGAWHVEVKIPERVARGARAFVAGADGGLSSPDWQRVAAATLVGGSATSCTFRLEGLTDASKIDVGVTEVRPVR